MSYGKRRASTECYNGNTPFCAKKFPDGDFSLSPDFTENEFPNEINDTTDVSVLVPGSKIRSSSVKAVVVENRGKDSQGVYSRSFPTQIPQDNLLVEKKSAYGSVPNEPGTSQRIIYCSHGHPTGCCVTSDSDLLANGFSPTAPVKRKESVTATFFQEHCHQSRPASVDKKARRKLIIASILCVVFMVGEVVGGVLSSSLAIATDAAHLLTDFASFMISLFSLWVASRPPTRTMSFGWYRAEVIGALTSVLLIWVVTGILVYLAVMRVITRDFEIESVPMLITSGVGVFVNIIMALTLHQHGHTHSHSHCGRRQREELESGHARPENINVRAAYIHVIGDFIQSFGVFIAAIIIFFKPTWGLVDPICTFLFSVLVLFTTFAILKDTMLVLMEGMPKGIDFVQVMNSLLEIDGVIRVHNLRIWALSMDKMAFSAHLAICPGMSPQKILQVASQKIRNQYEFFEMTLQIEEFNENMEDCSQCRCPET